MQKPKPAFKLQGKLSLSNSEFFITPQFDTKIRRYTEIKDATKINKILNNSFFDDSGNEEHKE